MVNGLAWTSVGGELLEVEVNVVPGTGKEMCIRDREVVKRRMNRILAANTGRSVEEVTADCERDNFMTAEEALQYGLIDKVIEKR